MGRDKYVIDMDEHFNSPRFAGLRSDEERFAALTADEQRIIAQELESCMDDFEHTCKNWFWVTAKSGQSKLFELWDGQRLVVEKMHDMRLRGKPQLVLVIKARQLGLSQLGAALACHKSIFSAGQNSLIISEDDDKTKRIWQEYAHPIYRQLPWYLRPQAVSESIEKGLVLDTDPKLTKQVGLKSSIRIVSASSTGTIQGMRLNMFHGSEFTSWTNFKDIIVRGIENALYEDPSTIGILESTAKGAGNVTHDFWRSMVRAADNARWEPVFLPFFMDRKHFLAPKPGWKPDKDALKRREVIASNWVRCDNQACAKYSDRNWGGRDRAGEACWHCHEGRMRVFIIPDGQLNWIQSRIKSAEDEGDEDDINRVLQEQASTAEEAFVVMGDKVFRKAAIEYAVYSAERNRSRKPWKGFMDPHGHFHGYKDGEVEEATGEVKRECCHKACAADHHKENRFLTVWDMPVDGASYSMGVDVSEGIGKDYSVVVVNRIGRGSPDVQVATYREHVTDPYNLAYRVNAIGRWYNNALCAVEYTGPGSTTANILLNSLQYPNIYKGKSTGDFSKRQGGGFHWLTNVSTKPRLVSTFERWLLDEVYEIRDPLLASEIKLYTKVEGTQKTEASKTSKDFHDDYLMAAMIAVYTAHQHDYDEEGGLKPFQIDATPENQPYTITCLRCRAKFGVSSMEAFGSSCPGGIPKCPLPECGSMLLTCRPNTYLNMRVPENPFKDVWNRDPEYFEGSNYAPTTFERPYNGFD